MTTPLWKRIIARILEALPRCLNESATPVRLEIA